MEQLTAYILPAVVAGIALFGLLKGVSVFDCFLEGAKEGVKTCVNLIPPLVGLIVMVRMLSLSGALTVISRLLSPVTRALGIPEELASLCLISPLSGSGALSMFDQILATHGPDSFIGRVASVMSGSTETTFYALTVYFGAVGIKKSRYTLAAALCGDLVCFSLSALTVRLLFP